MTFSSLTRAFLAVVALGASAQAGLIGYWTFDDDSLADSSGRGNTAFLPTTPGGPTGTAATPTFVAPPLPPSTTAQPFGVRAGATTAKYLNCNVSSGAALWVANPTPTDLFNFPGGRYSISFWTRNAWALGSSGVAQVAKGGETYNAVAQGWQVQRFAATSDPGFVTRGFGSNSGAGRRDKLGR